MSPLEWWRVRTIGARLAVLSVSGEVTEEIAEEVRMLTLELNKIRGGPAPALPPAPEPRALPPAARVWTPQRTTRAGETEEQKQRRLRANVFRSRTGAQSKIWDPEGDAARDARIQRGEEHVKGLIRRSAMHQAR